jgi:hypothetical protein
LAPFRPHVSADVVVALWLFLTLAGGVGWIMNAYKIVRICCELDAWLVFRAFGIVVPPLGAVLGFV